MGGNGARWSGRMRTIHRWTSVVFTAVVAFTTVATVTGMEIAEWIYFTPLPFLAVLLITGLYLFVLPYRTRSRERPTTVEVPPG